MVNYSQSESTISRGKDSAASKDAGQLVLADQLREVGYRVVEARDADDATTAK
jgi:hypothetical protein